MILYVGTTTTNISVDEGLQTFQAFWPELVECDLKTRIRSRGDSRTPSSPGGRGDSGTPSPGGTSQNRVSRAFFCFLCQVTDHEYQNMKTVTDVRMRDRKCLATGQEVMDRQRGANFTGFEVAHIHPMMGVNNVSDYGLGELWFHLTTGNAERLDSTSSRNSQRTCGDREDGRSTSQCHSSAGRCP
jgi:hypothetical protein